MRFSEIGAHMTFLEHVIKTPFNLNMEEDNARKGKFLWTEEETALLLKVVLDY